MDHTGLGQGRDLKRSGSTTKKKFFCVSSLREPQKKVPPLMAGPLRWGGGVKAGPLRKKELF